VRGGGAARTMQVASETTRCGCVGIYRRDYVGITRVSPTLLTRRCTHKVWAAICIITVCVLYGGPHGDLYCLDND
jgi:hypothetical protein